ncbi:hypothetical protein C2E23DRAFT_863453 [Lenzites betulinus]|nr:hypothetical protein C2E23DRAFT_863453 [Lenzites betulinus]
MSGAKDRWDCDDRQQMEQIFGHSLAQWFPFKLAPVLAHHPDSVRISYVQYLFQDFTWRKHALSIFPEDLTLCVRTDISFKRARHGIKQHRGKRISMYGQPRATNAPFSNRSSWPKLVNASSAPSGPQVEPQLEKGAHSGQTVMRTPSRGPRIPGCGSAGRTRSPALASAAARRGPSAAPQYRRTENVHVPPVRYTSRATLSRLAGAHAVVFPESQGGAGPVSAAVGIQWRHPPPPRHPASTDVSSASEAHCGSFGAKSGSALWATNTPASGKTHPSQEHYTFRLGSGRPRPASFNAVPSRAPRCAHQTGDAGHWAGPLIILEERPETLNLNQLSISGALPRGGQKYARIESPADGVQYHIGKLVAVSLLPFGIGGLGPHYKYSVAVCQGSHGHGAHTPQTGLWTCAARATLRAQSGGCGRGSLTPWHWAPSIHARARAALAVGPRLVTDDARARRRINADGPRIRRGRCGGRVDAIACGAGPAAWAAADSTSPSPSCGRRRDGKLAAARGITTASARMPGFEDARIRAVAFAHVAFPVQHDCLAAPGDRGPWARRTRKNLKKEKKNQRGARRATSVSTAPAAEGHPGDPAIQLSRTIARRPIRCQAACCYCCSVRSSGAQRARTPASAPGRTLPTAPQREDEKPPGAACTHPESHSDSGSHRRRTPTVRARHGHVRVGGPRKKLCAEPPAGTRPSPRRTLHAREAGPVLRRRSKIGRVGPSGKQPCARWMSGLSLGGWVAPADALRGSTTRARARAWAARRGRLVREHGIAAVECARDAWKARERQRHKRAGSLGKKLVALAVTPGFEGDVDGDSSLESDAARLGARGNDTSGDEARRGRPAG